MPFEKWREISINLYEKYNLPFILTGDINEKEYINKLSKYIVGKKEIVAGKTTLVELKNILKKAYLTVSTDSGPMHISAVYKTPTIGIFPKNSRVISCPFGKWSVKLQTKFDDFRDIDINEGIQRVKEFL